MQEVYLFSYRIRGYEYFFVPHKKQGTHPRKLKEEYNEVKTNDVIVINISMPVKVWRGRK